MDSSVSLIVILCLLIAIAGLLFLVLFHQRGQSLRQNQQRDLAAAKEQQILDLTTQLTLSQAENNHSAQNISQLQQDLTTAQNKLEQAQQEYQQTLERNIKLENQHVDLDAKCLKLTQDLQESQEQKEELRQRLTHLQADLASIQSQNTSLMQLRAEDEKRFTEGNALLEQKIQNLGQTLLNQQTESFTSSNQKNMTDVISPLQHELAVFRELISSSQKNQSEQAGQLRNELLNLQKSQQALSSQANELALALKQGGKSQGMWGEHQLEMVLESSGLTLDREYFREVAGENIDGERGRVDVVVALPQNHCILIDAKCSLTAYTEYVNFENELGQINPDLAPEEEQKHLQQVQDLAANALKRHLDSLRKHINELSAKKYPSFEKFNSPSFTFMFVPIDNALSVASQQDCTLFEEAKSKNIYLISPSSLLPALHVVSNVWIITQQQQQIAKLITSAQRIYDKSIAVSNIYASVVASKHRFDESMHKLDASLFSGNGNLMKILSNFSTQSSFNQNLLDKALSENVPQKEADEIKDFENPSDIKSVIAK